MPAVHYSTSYRNGVPMHYCWHGQEVGQMCDKCDADNPEDRYRERLDEPTYLDDLTLDDVEVLLHGLFRLAENRHDEEHRLIPAKALVLRKRLQDEMEQRAGRHPLINLYVERT